LILLNKLRFNFVKQVIASAAKTFGQLNRREENNMKSAIVKRSVVLNGHKTSVSLENEFWEGLRDIGDAKNAKLSELVRQVDQDRSNGNLSSAIRVFVLSHFRGQPQDAAPQVEHAEFRDPAWSAETRSAS
jgi:predicted DNA-binding ribbon-helix-helix protein